MAKSVLVLETDEQGHFYFSLAGGTLTLGDAPGHPGLLVRELKVRSIRCEIELDQDAATLSKPGAEGQPGLQREIHVGQAARLGHTRLYLTNPAEEAENPGASGPASAAAPAPAAVEGTFKRLRVVDGADVGRAFRLPAEAGEVSIGKSKHAEVVLHDLYVSRVHCVVTVAEGKVIVRHQEGDNGTLINGKRIAAPQELQIGDVLRVGNSHLRLETAATLDHAAEEKEVEDEDELPAKEDPTDEIETVDETHELVGRVFGHYRVAQFVGKGHSGEVFRARDVRNNAVVTLKVLSPRFPADGQELQHFVQAMKAATQQHHANLVTIHTAGRTGQHCWIAREHVEGESAAALARRAAKSKGTWPRACRVAVHLARALGHLHQQRLVHGDVTPENVLIGKDGVTRLADVMLDKALEGSKLQEAILEKKLLAVLPFLAPEQTDPAAFVDYLADLYSLGAVVYLLLTGRPPFASDNAADVIEQIREKPVVRPSTYVKDVPAAFEAAVMRLLAKHQEDRYQTVEDLGASVEAIAKEYRIEV